MNKATHKRKLLREGGYGSTLVTLKQERKASVVDGKIAPINYIFDLVKTKELISMEDN